MPVRSTIWSRPPKSPVGLRDRPIPTKTSPAPDRPHAAPRPQQSDEPPSLTNDPTAGFAISAAAADTAAVADPRSRILPGTKSITHFTIGADSNVLANHAIHVDTVSLPCHQHRQSLISGELRPKTTPFALPWINDAAVTSDGVDDRFRRRYYRSSPIVCVFLHIVFNYFACG